MTDFVAALPMYDWPETRAATDGDWHRLRDSLRENGIAAPRALTRTDDPAALWRRPELLLSQTCWGPMEAGLAAHVTVLGQPDYSAHEGGAGPLYASVVLMRAADAGPPVCAPEDGTAALPLERLRGRRLAYNDPVSMSGMLALIRDLVACGAGPDIFAARRASGSHRASIVAVAAGEADICAVDCQSWTLARRFEPAAEELRPVGWTARRPGLPFITARSRCEATIALLRRVLRLHGLCAG